jgi:hypothetical protein
MDYAQYSRQVEIFPDLARDIIALTSDVTLIWDRQQFFSLSQATSPTLQSMFKAPGSQPLLASFNL